MKYNLFNLLQDDNDQKVTPTAAGTASSEATMQPSYLHSKLLKKYFMDWWVYELFLLARRKKLGYSLNWLTTTVAPCENTEIWVIVSKIDTQIKWNKIYCAF